MPTAKQKKSALNKSTTKITKKSFLYKPMKTMLLTVTNKAASMEYFEAHKDQRLSYFSMYYNTHIDKMKAFFFF